MEMEGSRGKSLILSPEQVKKLKEVAALTPNLQKNSLQAFPIDSQLYSSGNTPLKPLLQPPERYLPRSAQTCVSLLGVPNTFVHSTRC